MSYQRKTCLDSGVLKTGGLLLAVILHNLIYPLSTGKGIGPVVFYCVYASMFVVATWLLTDSTGLRISATGSGLAVLLSGLVNAFAPTAATGMAVYVTSMVYHGVIIIVLARYTFMAHDVFTDVILAATSLYLIIGSSFAAIFACIEALAPGSFVSASGMVLDWQQLLYFSYVTLTSLGYGDILPAGFYAQAFAAFEAIVGVLYTVILLSRLVGMHTAARA
ncbi:ion channel [Granulosicoccus sp. 3-233]|uniref:ion channel n=1 Tax=Granulosicoccus sp. 3-233 TaxID=3417969 RepID=UPI003D358A2E